MYLVITIDTEEDNWGEYALPSYSVENLRRIPKLQAIFDKHNVRPTYLISHPVATSPLAVETLGKYREAGRCEIGAHPHPWNTPPVEEERIPANSFISYLPVDLQFRKLKTLHETIASNFGVAPRSYRSGRWGFSDEIARHLIRLGYAVDTSLSPLTDWGEYGGPDYSDRDLTPFIYEEHGRNGSAGGTLLEVPATVDFLQRQPHVAGAAYWTFRRRVPGGAKILAALSRMRVLNHISFSPELHDAPQLVSLLKALRARGTRVANMFFHSPSLLEGCSPFVRTAADADAFLERIDRVLGYAKAAGLQSATISELTATKIGALLVRPLAPETAVA